jgi:TctA family transporter
MHRVILYIFEKMYWYIYHYMFLLFLVVIIIFIHEEPPPPLKSHLVIIQALTARIHHFA